MKAQPAPLIALAAALSLPSPAFADAETETEMGTDADAGICDSAGTKFAPGSVARIGSQGRCLVKRERAGAAFQPRA